jgi:adenylosuccinate synthase
MPTELIGNDADRAIGDQIRQRGREFGTTTGRPRRVGWLDLTVVKYSARLNGAKGLSVMLLDVLGAFEQLQVCTAYTIDGQVTDRLTPHADWMARAKPVYQTMPGIGDVSAARKKSELSKAAVAYLDLIEATVGVPVRFVSVGPGREQTIEYA